MLAAVGDRPTFIERYPDGVQGDQIYQKRIARRRPEHVLSTPITFPSGRKGDALRPTVPADIVWAANYGTVVFHTWPTRHPDNDHPDQLRIDLDRRREPISTMCGASPSNSSIRCSTNWACSDM